MNLLIFCNEFIDILCGKFKITYVGAVWRLLLIKRAIE